MSIPTPTRRTLAVAGCLLLLGACASTTPAPRFSAVSPADPAASESAAPAPVPRLTGGGELAENETVYTCPMHPKVVAREPGPCPICEMALVKKAIAPKERP